MAVLGIDFGMVTSRVAALDSVGNEREIAIPSAVAVLGTSLGDLLVGEGAETAADARPAAVISGLKRLLGRLPGDPVAEDLARRQGATLSLVNGQLVCTTAAGTSVAVEDAVAAVLREAALRAAGMGTHQAVLCIPEWFEPRQEAALGAAAARAGLEIIRFIEDAAAMALTLRPESGQPTTAGYVHLGAGALGVSFATVEPRSVFMLASFSDRRVGGNDVTEALMEVALRQSMIDPAMRVACWRAIESMKLELTHADESRRTVPYVDGGRAATRDITLRADELDGALAVLREPLAELYEEAVDEAALEPDEIDVVYAVGGMGAHPAVADMILEITGQVPHCEPLLSGMAARGAMRQATILHGGQGPLVFDGKSTGSLHSVPSDDS